MVNRSLLRYRGALTLMTGALLLLSAVHYQTRKEATDFLREREDLRVRIQVLEQENGALNAETEDWKHLAERYRQAGKP